MKPENTSVRGGCRMILRGFDMIELPYFTNSDRQAIANSVDPDQTPQNAASDQGLRLFPLTQQVYKHS